MVFHDTLHGPVWPYRRWQEWYAIATFIHFVKHYVLHGPTEDDRSDTPLLHLFILLINENIWLTFLLR